MKKIIVLFLLILCAGIYWKFFNAGKIIPIEDLYSNINVDKSVKLLTLKRGKYEYTLKREDVLNSKEFFVDRIDVFSDTNDEIKVEDLYCASFALIPADDERAMRAKDLFNGGNSFDIPVEDVSKGQNIMDDMNHLNEATKNFVILPADDKIKEIAKKVKKGNRIKINGVSYKHYKVKKDNEEQLLVKCLENTNVIYADKFEILK